MSIIIAIRSRFAVVVAADSQRVSSKGLSEAPFDKTFRLRGGIIGAWVGLMDIGMKSVGQHLVEALGGRTLAIDGATEFAHTVLADPLAALPDQEVAFCNRRVDLIFASRLSLRALSFDPIAAERRFVTTTLQKDSYLVAGTDAAKSVSIARLARARGIHGLRMAQLRELARSAAEVGIAAGGPSPHWSAVPACCGPVRLVSSPDPRMV
jgi:hypothetical protein